MATIRHKLWINGQWETFAEGGSLHGIISPFHGEAVAAADYASPAQMEKALAAAALSGHCFRKTSRHIRSRLLSTIAEAIAARRAEFVKLMVDEAGKPVMMADVEITRAIVTFTVAAEEAKRFGGEVIPLDVDGAGRGYGPAISSWVPRGPVFGITPFNFPLNLVAHKVAPALAAGCPIIIKPAPHTPGAAALLAEIFEKAVAQVADGKEAIPVAALQVVSCTNEVAGIAVTDPRITTVSFTGSTRVGWMLQQKAIGKRIMLELGGNAAVIIHNDADIARAALRCAVGGNAYAGQSCISVQRILVHQDVAKKFEQLLLAETQKLIVGDPAKKDVTVGPVIDLVAAERIIQWVEEAKQAGVRVVCGGTRNGNVVAPTILAASNGTKGLSRLKVSCEEVFAPVVLMTTYEEFSEAIAAVNDSRFGLQAGVFTDSQKLIHQAIDDLEVGGVMVNEVPTYRADPMPYGGVKESGLGREGLRYAMEEYSERKTVVQWNG